MISPVCHEEHRLDRPSGDLHKEDLRRGQQEKKAYSGAGSMKVKRIKRNPFN